MLKQLSFKNFKTWKSAELRFGRITGLFGTNSSGKSSLLQFLLLLKQTKEATDRAVSLELNGPYVELGTYKDVVFNHDETFPISWKVELELERDLILLDPSKRRGESLARSKAVSVEGSVKITETGPVADKLTYHVGQLGFALKQKPDSETAFNLSVLGSDFKFVRTTGRAWQLPGPIKSYAFPDQARTYFQNASMLSDLEAAFENQLDNIFYLGPLREYPKRDYLWTRSRPRDVGQKGEKTIEAILAATNAGELRNRKAKSRLQPFQEMIAYWLQEMGLIERFTVTEIGKDSNRWQAKVQVRKSGAEVLLTDVGFGVSQVLPVVTLLQYVPEGATVILEQPEIHLHPLAQASLADVIVNTAINRNIQVIIESHSEHMLLRMQRRIAEAELSNEEIKLYFCDSHSAGQSTITELELDIFGTILNWPKNFMGDALGEAFAAEKARLKRMT